MQDHTKRSARSPMLRRRRLVLALLAGASMLGVGSVTAASGAGGDTTPTTITRGDGSPVPGATGPSIDAARAAVSERLAGSTVTGAHEMNDGRTSYVDLEGTLADGATFVLTIYRVFEASELAAAELPVSVSPLGTTWIGAENESLTSVYFLSTSGTGVWLGVTPARDADAISVTRVAADAASLAALPSVAAISREAPGS